MEGQRLVCRGSATRERKRASTAEILAHTAASLMGNLRAITALISASLPKKDLVSSTPKAQHGLERLLMGCVILHRDYTSLSAAFAAVVSVTSWKY